MQEERFRGSCPPQDQLRSRSAPSLRSSSSKLAQLTLEQILEHLDNLRLNLTNTKQNCRYRHPSPSPRGTCRSQMGPGMLQDAETPSLAHKTLSTHHLGGQKPALGG